MISLLGAVSSGFGATIAYVGGRYPRHQGLLETVGGILLIAGFALIGYALQCIVGRP
jgi:hypothetical protein